MKKKLAVLLALCLTLGALPLSALAATYKGTATINGTATEITFDVNEVEGEETTVSNIKGVPTDAANYYAAAPATLTAATDTTPAKATFDLVVEYYGEAPATIPVTGTIVVDTVTVPVAVEGEKVTATANVDVTTIPDDVDEFTLDATVKDDGTEVSGEDVKAAEITMPAALVEKLATVPSTTIKTPVATVTVPSEAFTTLGTDKPVTLVVEPKDEAVTKITEALPTELQSETIVACDVTLKVDGVAPEGGLQVTKPITIAIPIVTALQGKSLAVVYVDDTEPANVKYSFVESNVQGTDIVITTNHLSTYALMTKDAARKLEGVEVPLDKITVTSEPETGITTLTVEGLTVRKWIYFQVTGTDGEYYGDVKQIAASTEHGYSPVNGTVRVWVFEEKPTFSDIGTPEGEQLANNGNGTPTLS